MRHRQEKRKGKNGRQSGYEREINEKEKLTGRWNAEGCLRKRGGGDKGK